MKASVQYNDFKGTAAADIADSIGQQSSDNLAGLGKYFKIDEKRFRVVGISITGVQNLWLSLICVDREKSNEGKEHIVKISYDADDKEVKLQNLFKRLNIVLYDRFDDKYPDIDYDEEASFLDFHESEE